jgi:hypothetical protein
MRDRGTLVVELLPFRREHTVLVRVGVRKSLEQLLQPLVRLRFVLGDHEAADDDAQNHPRKPSQD